MMSYADAVQMLLGEYKASDMHRSNLGQLVAQQGLESMDEHIVCAILQYIVPRLFRDQQLTCCRQNQYWLDAGMQPILPVSSPPTPIEYPPVPFPPNLQWQVDCLPDGFRQLACDGGVAVSNLCILFRVHNVHLDLQMDKVQTRLDPSVLDGNHHYRTLLDACPVLRMPDTEDSIFQKILCWTLLIYSMVYLGNANAVSPLPLSARRDLTTRLLRLPQQQSTALEECVFWMWHVAVHSWRNPNGQIEGDGKTLKQLERARFKHWCDERRTEQILGRFSWSSKVCINFPSK